MICQKNCFGHSIPNGIMNGLRTVTLYDKFIIITDTTKYYFSGKGSYIYVTYSKYKPNLKRSRQYAK